MSTFEHVVCAYDGTENSKDALKLAINVSKQLSSTLSVVHVLQEKKRSAYRSADNIQVIPIGGYGTDGLLNSPTTGYVHDNVEQENVDITENTAIQLTSEARQILENNNSAADIKLLEGDASEAIVFFAEEHKADLIVMGSRDISGLKKLLYGSVSEKVSKHSNIPVLIAK
ncbi:universal stress protein [Metabacillus herbersteinensis]|uniref:Universal stress protein n=1 Tax=Metabacillus herbersteinensis TaxID=283816 RepID=A0ABV6GEN2_9BACI